MKLKLNKVTQAILLAFSFSTCSTYATEFNLNVLDAEDIENVDMSQFSIAGYVPPGQYVLTTFVNGQRLGAPRDISIIKLENTENTAAQLICIPLDMLEIIGLNASGKEKVTTTQQGQCLDLSALSGIQTKVELPTLSLNITIPQTWMEYRDPYWIPPALWEEGVNGGFIDYSANFSFTDEDDSTKRTYLSTNGTVGVNLGAWRVRGDFNAIYQKREDDGSNKEQHNFDFNRFYAFTSLKDISSVLTVGENYFYSDVFESWQYSGVSLESDDRMLPPKLVGYAPEIIGVANTNATVTVRSQDRIVLETTVPPGPFRIQTLDSGVRGVLDVTVREENGEEKKFSINTASLPYLTRPGRMVYKLAAGKTRYDAHSVTGRAVLSGEFSYGLSNAWSLYGGSQLNGDYQTLAVGIGRDLFSFGALSLDIAQSVSNFEDQTLQGRSYRLSYAKSFNDLRTDITFAGYRFADQEYRTLNQFMSQDRTGIESGGQKENYQIYLNKYFDKFNLSLNYQYSTYWQNKPQTQYGLYASTYFKMPGASKEKASVSLSATRAERDTGLKDDSINLYLTLPLSSGRSISLSELYSKTGGNNQFNHSVGYSAYNDRDNYSVNAGYNHGENVNSQSSISGYYSRDLSQANISVNASYVPEQYSSVGASIRSGLTVTSKGVASHRSANGDTRLMIETPGASAIPLENGVTKTNSAGLAVLPNISSYRQATASINTSKLPDNVEALISTTDITLTKGAIGYRSLSVMKGDKLFAVLSLDNGKNPPFGASVRNTNNRELGIVGEDGVTWLIGVAPKEKLSVYWGGKVQCELWLPEKIESSSSMLDLSCISGKETAPVASSISSSQSIN
ncbi:fimbria/pilus outer membrane usher protein [Acinetobacter guerrae]|uniref:fimbria/pilus outer membrane usher protein n=1 Tax=Acinetobacter guerrae TaxID=1843371 RepID=UPI00125FB4B2|nr:fimbria/pilus outer membrane usher protein [Acinetobacter guerrae]